jgi:hypothetical protein
MKTTSVFIHSETKVLGAIGHQTGGKFGGVGGKLERTDLSPAYGAFRELLEELFHSKIATVPRPILAECLAILGEGKRSRRYPDHVVFYISVAQLESIMKKLKAARIKTAFYYQFPTTVSSLIQGRLPVPSELIRIQLLSKERILEDSSLITNELLNDLLLI